MNEKSINRELIKSCVSFKTYQELAEKTAVYPNKGSNFVYPALGLGGEVGEVQEKIKKVIRDQGGELDEETRLAIKKELGDVLWYIAALCGEFDLSLADVALLNLEKLQKRQEANLLHGNGDDRESSLVEGTEAFSPSYFGASIGE